MQTVATPFAAGPIAKQLEQLKLLMDCLASGLPRVETDRHQIRQMVGNLYLNALEAIGDAPGRVTVTTGFESIGSDVCVANGDGSDSSSEFVYLRVLDTGCGIDDAIRPRIFDPFFTRKFIGRGLGLSAVQRIVRAQWFDSCIQSTGQGHCF